jgi:hypothetical protein
MHFLASFLDDVQRCFHRLVQLGAEFSLVKTFFVSNQLFMKFLLFEINVISFTLDVLLLLDDSESSKEMIVLVNLVLVAPEHSDE